MDPFSQLDMPAKGKGRDDEASIQEAGQKILSLLNSCRRDENISRDETMAKITDIVRHTPSVSTVRYDYDRVRYCSIVELFLVFGADLDQIQKLMEACGTFREELCCTINGLLHTACANSTSDVIEYLMNLYPKVVSEKRRNDGLLPLHVALKSISHDRQISVHVMRRMMELNPEALSSEKFWRNYPLELALINRDCPLEVIDCMVELFPAGCERLYLMGKSDYTEPEEEENKLFIDSGRAKTLAKLLSKLDLEFFDLGLSPRWENPEAFKELLGQLERHQTPRRLQLPVPHELLTHPTDIKTAISDMFRNNAQLKTLHLSCDTVRWNPSIGTHSVDHSELLRELATSGKGKTLSMDNFVVGDTCALGQFLSSGAGPSTVLFFDLRVVGNWSHQAKPSLLNPSFGSGIEDLSFHSCEMSISVWSNLIQYLSYLPQLKGFELVFDRWKDDEDDFDLTDPVVSLLTNGKLTSFVMSGGNVAKVNMRVLCLCLRANNILQRFCVGRRLADKDETDDLVLDLLQNHNTTINCTERFNWSVISNPEIYYYCNLNAFGRSQVRSPKLTMSSLAGILFRVMNDNTRLTKPLDKENTLYGLLREAPDSWCVGVSNRRGSASRKRKTPDD
jgi:hypothetical protein